jgi:hypothetical protein
MFSMEEKQAIATAIEKILLDLNHPEMPKDKPSFELFVQGAQTWSWAVIKPNWTFEGPDAEVPGKNPWNEIARQVIPESPVDNGK